MKIQDSWFMVQGAEFRRIQEDSGFRIKK